MAPASPTAPKPKRVVPVLALLVALGPFSIDMYLPAFPAIRDALATTEAQVQLTLSVFMLVMACGQILFGALSDRVGRRPVFLAGLTLFVLASVGCSQAGGVGVLVSLRALQALGGCAAVVVGYAVVRDLWPAAGFCSVSAGAGSSGPWPASACWLWRTPRLR